MRGGNRDVRAGRHGPFELEPDQRERLGRNQPFVQAPLLLERRQYDCKSRALEPDSQLACAHCEAGDAERLRSEDDIRRAGLQERVEAVRVPHLLLHRSPRGGWLRRRDRLHPLDAKRPTHPVVVELGIVTRRQDEGLQSVAPRAAGPHGRRQQLRLEQGGARRQDGGDRPGAVGSAGWLGFEERRGVVREGYRRRRRPIHETRVAPSTIRTGEPRSGRPVSASKTSMRVRSVASPGSGRRQWKPCRPSVPFQRAISPRGPSARDHRAETAVHVDPDPPSPFRVCLVQNPAAHLRLPPTLDGSGHAPRPQERGGGEGRQRLAVAGVVQTVEGAGEDWQPRWERSYRHGEVQILDRDPRDAPAVAAQLDDGLAVPLPRLIEPVGVQQDARLQTVVPEPRGPARQGQGTALPKRAVVRSRGQAPKVGRRVGGVRPLLG